MFEVSPLQMAMAYATFAGGGVKRQPRYVTEVKAANGEILASVPPDPGRRVLDPIAAAQMSTILRGVVERGTARKAFAGYAGPFSGKTGTTNSARDAWFVGFSPEIVVAVWIGRDDNKALADDAGGGKVAAPVVRDFLEQARIRTTPFVAPPEAKSVTVDPETGVASQGRNAVAEIVREIPELPTARTRRTGPPKAPVARVERPRDRERYQERYAAPDMGPAEAVFDVQP